jgi:hypothetical protein
VETVRGIDQGTAFVYAVESLSRQNVMPTNAGKLAVASDQDALTATSIRTVIIEAAADTIIGSSTASSAEAFHQSLKAQIALVVVKSVTPPAARIRGKAPRFHDTPIRLPFPIRDLPVLCNCSACAFIERSHPEK